MRRALIITAAAALMLGACGGDDSDQTDDGGGDTATSASTTSTTVNPRGAGRSDYLNGLLLVDSSGDLERIPEGRLYDLGLIACDELDQGASVTDVFDRLQQEPEFDLTAGQSTVGVPLVTVEASLYLCPEHQAQVRAEVGAG